MIFQVINREDAEQVFSIFKNVAAATIAKNYPVVWDVDAPDGVLISKPATATLSLFVGVSDEEILDDAYGKVQVYGYRAACLVTNDTSVAIAAGDILIPVTAVWHTARSGASDGKSGFLYAAEAFATNATPAAVNKKVFIRAM